jgi:UDP-N-acetylmuramyl pentapeptide phosphotransferase/UDP-N-acetylglucosamine-1-phosphate transferase
MIWLITAGVGLACLGLSLAGCGWVRAVLLRRQVLDLPNHRSSHAEPVPRGGGLAVMPIVVVAWLAWMLFWPFPPAIVLVPLAALALAAVSFVDDLRGLPAALRLAAQAAAVAVGLSWLPADALAFQGLLPLWLDRLLLGVAWLWFVNAFNFMDGIDGISAVETAAIAVGVLIVLAHDVFMNTMTPFAAALLGAALGFLWWNRPPARLFLGDVGSVGLGYLLGFLLVVLAVTGQWQAALILPAYYLADATITLGRRALAGEKVWQAHRSHFYQRAARALGGHAPVTRIVAALNGLLVACAWYAVACQGEEWRALAVAAVGTAAVVWYFAHVEKRAAHG